MRVLFIASSVAGVVFWRMFQFWDHMKRAGVDCYLYGMDVCQSINNVDWQVKFERGDERIRKQVYELMMRADIIVFQYTPIPIMLALQGLFQEEYKKVVLSEIDDDILRTPSYNPAYREGYEPGSIGEKTVREQIKTANGVIVSTGKLRDIYSALNPKVHVMHNSIDFERWNLKVNNGKRKLRIGWIGGGNHERDMVVLKDVIPEILKRYKNVEFRFTHGAPSYIRAMKDERVKFDGTWTNIDKYPNKVASMGLDIGIAPLEYNRFNECKSNLRWLEYSALGIPSVCTDIYPYKHSIEDGKTGMLADTTSDWINKLSALIENPELRKTVGDAAKQEVSEKWEIKKETSKYIETLKRYRDEQVRLTGRN